jgi:hypothetical protein
MHRSLALCAIAFVLVAQTRAEPAPQAAFADPGAASLAQPHVDLEADNIARDGVAIDVRNNNGGFVNVHALDVLSRSSSRGTRA